MEIKAKLESSIKVGHRLTQDSENWSYLNTMPLHTARLWSRIRCYAIKVLKYHISDLNCRFCTTNVPESQEHLEICAGRYLAGVLEESDSEVIQVGSSHPAF